jgi:uncharacterized protein
VNQFMVAFITGLTTGGLSCLAVQGGLLATSLAHQIENDLVDPARSRTTARKSQSGKNRPPVKDTLMAGERQRLAFSISLFLVAKIIVYTLLGFLLGMLGSVLQLNAITRAILQFGIGIFMIGNALRMFNVHPIFRYFALEPPHFVTRFIRKTAKGNTDVASPLFLGALTVLIPCGVTQAMMALAVGSGSPIQGMNILLGFTLGTSPVFFIVAFLTTQLGATLEKYFMRIVAVLVLILGFLSIESGLNLVGSPFSISNVARSLRGNPQPAQVVESTQIPLSNEILLNVTNTGYQPEVLHARANETITLNLKTEGVISCSRDFVIASLNIEKLLPETGNVQVEIPPQEPGSILYYSCSMGMFTGKIIFDG